MPTQQARRVDRRVVRTRKAIMNAFDKLVSKGDIDKITVSAIAREADIDRKTFYLHYKSIDDLVGQRTEDLLGRVIDRLKAEGMGKSLAERVHIVLSEVNAILTSDIAVYANIASRVSTDQMLELFAQATEPVLENAGVKANVVVANQQVMMRLQFYIAGALSLYTSWLKSNRADPIETVSRAIENAICNAVPVAG